MGSNAAAAASAFQLTPEEDDEACVRARQLTTGVVLPMVLKTAIELGLLQMLVDAGPASALGPDEIAARLPTQNPSAPDMIDRILRLLAANDIVRCAAAEGGRRKYSPAPICKYLTDNAAAAGSLANLILKHQDKVVINIWHGLKEAILNGGHPVLLAYGMTTFEYQAGDPRFNKVFNDAMKSASSFVFKHLLPKYNGFDGVGVLVDVGGNIGGNIHMITCFHPHIKGINFDLPHIIAGAPPLPGVEHRGGDMFESVPAGDAIFLKLILHDWSDELCVKLLKNCWKSLPEKGKVIVMETVVPAVPDSSTKSKAILQLDLCMMAYNVGGKERTEEEFRALAVAAGFRGFNLSPVFADSCVMEFIK
ncbi:caffeic acid 3-O-methyltransferase-like [Zingiber officinale]|uniref:Uncharacterized protein n=1 Tax=Zingiber officinale TaxID=94328 RepID=A0A8J5ENC6_ZINOF|nr:caffeic acid 3-O-methyltransferase-like [Zingiber officinale]KAG6469965.1 hypothetical protein ZIOFF_070904 [Zingiber officinale]